MAVKKEVSTRYTWGRRRMNDMCEMPPSFSFELPVLGPFTARESLVLGALLLPSLPLFRVSIALAVAFLAASSFFALVLLLQWRRGKHPFRNILSFLSIRSLTLQRLAHSSSAHRPVNDGLEAFSIEELNYVCAVDSEKEEVMSSFLRLCSSLEGCLRLLSVPLQPYGLSELCGFPCIPGTDEAQTVEIRSFYMTLDQHNQPEGFGGAKLQRISSECPHSFHSLLTERVPGWDVR